jgi:hypothetical protein
MLVNHVAAQSVSDNASELALSVQARSSATDGPVTGA